MQDRDLLSLTRSKMLVDGRDRFLDRAAQVIAADKADGKKLDKERFVGYSQQELRLAQLKALRIR